VVAGGAERDTAHGAATSAAHDDGSGAASASASAFGAVRGRLGAVLPPIASARTWLAVIHLLAGFVLGMLSFTLLITGAAIGVALLPLFLSGVPVLIAVRWLCGQFCRSERARFNVLLGVRISGLPPRPDGGTWRPVPGGRSPRRRRTAS